MIYQHKFYRLCFFDFCDMIMNDYDKTSERGQRDRSRGDRFCVEIT